jgi:hypothetical protein
MGKVVLLCAFFVLMNSGSDAAAAQSAPAADPAKTCIEQFAAKEYGAAADSCLQAARMGDSEAEFRMGALTYGALTPSVKPDNAAFLEWIARASDHGISEARYIFGLAYDNGSPRNVQAAKYWYGLAAGQGHDQAKNKLAEVEKEIASTGVPAVLSRRGPITQDAPTSFQLRCDVKVNEGSFLHCHYGDILNFVADSIDNQSAPETVIAHIPGGQTEQDGKVIRFADMTFFYRATKTDVEPADYVNRWLQVSASQFSGFVKQSQRDLVWDGVPATSVRYTFRDSDGQKFHDEAIIAAIKGWAVMGVARIPLTEPRDNLVEVAEAMTAARMLEKTTFSEWFRRLALTGDAPLPVENTAHAPSVSAAAPSAAVPSAAVPSAAVQSLQLAKASLTVRIPSAVSAYKWTSTVNQNTDRIEGVDAAGRHIIVEVFKPGWMRDCGDVRKNWPNDLNLSPIPRPSYVPERAAAWWFVDKNGFLSGCTQNAASAYILHFDKAGQEMWAPMVTAVIEAIRDRDSSGGS